MKSQEKGLTVCSFVFGLIAVVTIALTYSVPLLLHALYEQEGLNAKLGVMAFNVTFGLVMVAFGLFSWVASLVLMSVSLVYNRDGLRTILGRLGMALNSICLVYHAFIFCRMFIR